MAIERKWVSVGPVLLTQNGSSDGVLTLTSTAGFKVKQQVILSSNTQPQLKLEVKRVISRTQLIVGERLDTGSLTNKADVSSYLVADLANLYAVEQPKSKLKPDDIWQAIYDQEPAVALRNVLVDQFGDYYTVDNPMPVQLSNGSINIGTVNAELEVQLSHQDDVPDVGDVADSVRIGDGTDELEINDDGSINVKDAGLSGNPIIHKEYGTISDTTETTVATVAITNNNSKIAKFVGNANTLGLWKLYKNSISNANTILAYRTSEQHRTAALKFEQPDLLSSGDTVIVTFKADRFRTEFLGASSETFVRLEGFYP